MTAPASKLLQPITVGPLELKNRIMFPPLTTGYEERDGSIGERLYEAKVYLNTPDLFAWTVVIVLVSLVFEKLFLFLLDRLVARLERG